METKTTVELTVQKNNRIYRFSMEVGSPFGEAYDAAFEVLKNICEMSRQAVDIASQPQIMEEQ